jgi:hypothetical protein
MTLNEVFGCMEEPRGPRTWRIGKAKREQEGRRRGPSSLSRICPKEDDVRLSSALSWHLPRFVCAAETNARSGRQIAEVGV